MPYREIASLLAIVLTFVAFYPYIRAIRTGTVRPHIFSWYIWAVTTFIVFFAQLKGGAGVGAWPIGVSALVTLFIAVLAYRRRADISITRLDWLFFVMALSSLPLWFWTEDPRWAVVILTTVDLLGFAPTVRKAYVDPYSESIVFFGLFTGRNLCVILALEHYSVTTAMFPAAIGTVCVLMMVMLALRRRHLLR